MPAAVELWVISVIALLTGTAFWLHGLSSILKLKL